VPDGRSGLVGLDKKLTNIDSLEFVRLDGTDVVRHRIVADIVNAYERSDLRDRDTESRKGSRRA
jgi:phosphate starvation-inducible PhoH-like protein